MNPQNPVNHWIVTQKKIHVLISTFPEIDTYHLGKIRKYWSFLNKYPPPPPTSLIENKVVEIVKQVNLQ